MKIQGSKKNAFFILMAFIVIFAIILLMILSSIFGKKYPEEPIKMKNLGTSTQNIDMNSMQEKIEEEDVPVYFVQPKLHISKVEEMIDEMGLSLTRVDIVKDSYIEWSDEENRFTYDSVQDTVSFELKRKISLERGEQSFSSAFKKYLDLEYEFVLLKEKKNSDGGVTYYGSRTLGNIPIQFGASYEYSDILRFNKEGDLQSGQLLLAEIEKYDEYIPTISDRELKAYVNVKNYPKEHYIDTSVLGDVLNLSYLDDQWADIEATLTECKAQDAEKVFLYKNSNQGYLLPVIKISSNCKVTNGGNEYTVPTVFYVNGVNPKYVTL